jgi:hypothetical protein
MKSIRIIGSLFVISLLLASAHIFAQGMHAARYHYDPSKVTTVSGVITSVESTTRGWGDNTGTHLVIKTNTESLTVYAGPSSFLQNKISFAKGDKIEVTGARINVDGKPGIVAKEIKKGSAVIVLRNNDGTPLWSGQGRRQGR